MPLLNTITTPYAEAFLQVASSKKEVDKVVKQAKDILTIWKESPEFSEAMASPVLEVESKKAALEKLFAKQLTPSFLNLLKLLADRQRILVINKQELVDNVRQNQLLKDLQNFSSQKVILISAVMKQGLDQLLEAVWKELGI